MRSPRFSGAGSTGSRRVADPKPSRTERSVSRPAVAWLDALVGADRDRISTLLHPDVVLIDANTQYIRGVDSVLRRLRADGVFRGARLRIGDVQYADDPTAGTTLTVAEVHMRLPVAADIVSEHRIVMALSADVGVVRRIVIDADTL